MTNLSDFAMKFVAFRRTRRANCWTTLGFVLLAIGGNPPALAQADTRAPPPPSVTAPPKAAAAVLTTIPGASLKGRLGSATATAAEIEAALLLPGALKVPHTEELVRDAAELVLMPKLWARSGEAQQLNESEALYVQQTAELGRLRGWYDVHEARAVRRIASDPKALEARAREVYREKLLLLPAPIVASITVLDIQFARHGFQGSLARLQLAQQALERGVTFDAAVEQFSDAGTGQGSAMAAPKESTYTVDREQIEGALRTAVFRDLKPGDISGPIPVATGFVLVRLNARDAREKPSFESMRAAIESEIQADAVSRARLAARHKISIEAPVLDLPSPPERK